MKDAEKFIKKLVNTPFRILSIEELCEVHAITDSIK
jgi:hypothetical protein